MRPHPAVHPHWPITRTRKALPPPPLLPGIGLFEAVDTVPEGFCAGKKPILDMASVYAQEQSEDVPRRLHIGEVLCRI